MDEQRQDDQSETIYNSFVPIQDIALKTYWERWTMETGGERGLGKSMLTARHEDDDDLIKDLFEQMSRVFTSTPRDQGSNQRLKNGT